MLTVEDKEQIAAIVAASIGAALEKERAFTIAAIERGESALLTAFQTWASPTDQKLRSHRGALRAFDLQIEEIPGRVRKLEDAQELRH